MVRHLLEKPRKRAMHEMEVQHQRRRCRDGGRRILVAATEEGGGSDCDRERDERVTR